VKSGRPLPTLSRSLSDVSGSLSVMTATSVRCRRAGYCSVMPPSVIQQVFDDAIPIDALKEHPDNPRRGDDAAVSESIGVNKFYGAILIHKQSKRIIGGNTRWRAMRAAGAETVPGFWVSCSPAQAKRIMLADNRTSDLAEYDEQALVDLLAEIQSQEKNGLLGTGYTDDDLAGLLATLGSSPGLAPREDDAPKLPVKARSVLGDVWVLGPHRVVCGDATSVDVLDLLMMGEQAGCLLMDPPYGMNLDTDYSKMPGGNAKSRMNKQPKKYDPVIGDDEPFDAAFLRTYFGAVKEQFWFGADYYRSTLSQDDRDGSWLIWDKRKEDGSQDDVIGSTFETCWSAVPHQRRLLRHYWCGAFGAPEARDRMHPTQKPVALMADILTRWSAEGSIVADAFGGSGSTLIACHQTGRVARLVELDPRYVDVICRRYQDATGTHPVLEATGAPHDFTESTIG